MNVLVGYTGFVGSNIYKYGKFDKVFNSKNISEAYGTEPDLLVYAGLRAEKYLANNFPKKDMELILEAEENIRRINPKRLVLISTVDVLKAPNNMYENSDVDTEGLHPYGLNRYYLEQWVRKNYPDAVIIRLPGLFGINIKKNFIYDYINVIPFMLKEEKFNELVCIDSDLDNYYDKQENGFYRCIELGEDKKKLLKQKFRELGFSALNFTDSRAIYQFYPLNRLWEDINILLKNDIRLWHPATEPISVQELYKGLTNGNSFVNELNGQPVNYNFKTLYDKEFGGDKGYICSKDEIIDDIKKFVRDYE